MKYFWGNIRNSFDFFLRRKINLSRKNYSEHFVNISEIFDNEDEKHLYDLLCQKYDLSSFNDLSDRNFLENIYYLNIFDKCLSKNDSDSISILDIGSKNWSYARSEYAFFNSFSKEFVLDGIELDAYRLCSNLYNRYEIAKFYTKNLSNANYIVGDFMQHDKKYDYIIWILPFITEYPLLKWGLPLKYFKPEKMLIHAYNSLKPHGEMLIINQGEKEYQIQQELNKNIQTMPIYFGELPDSYGLFMNKRYGCKIIKSD